MEQIFVETARGRFAARAHGPEDAPAIVVLHGFPDDASTFDALAGGLADQGRRVIAPYLRGYAPSPLHGDLGLSELARDLIAMTEAVSPVAPVGFVGHDYGAQIGYIAMTERPDRFNRAVTLAGAHPAIVTRNMKKLPRQWWMSRYIMFFQLGSFADRRVAANDFAYIEALWRRWAPSFRAPPEHLAAVKRTLAASMPAPIAMYRAGGFDVAPTPIAVPTLLIVGEEDGCLLPATAECHGDLFTSGYEERVLHGVGHFPHLERPGDVLDAVWDWLQRPR